MENFLLYLLKMTVCSGVLFGYYRLFLMNETFHQWNRFYLLGALVLSVVVPLISIPVTANSDQVDLAAFIGILQMQSNVIAKETATTIWQNILVFASVATSVALLVKLLITIGSVINIYRSNDNTLLQNNIHFIVIDSSKAPFSFFNWLFWRRDIEIESNNGQKMLQHELTHIREHHSIDKLFTSTLLCAFWMNPFFWLMSKELGMIHEFLADRKAIGRHDAPAFALMILQALPIKQTFTNGLVNPFFSSQIKRRLLMITTSKKPRYTYARRIAALAIMIFCATAITLSIQKVEAQQPTKNTHEKSEQSSASDTGIIQKKKTITNTNKKLVIVTKTTDDKRINDTSKTKRTVIHLDARSNANDQKSPLYVVDGKEVEQSQIKDINPQQIKAINVLKGAEATGKYGEKGKDGVIVITMKSAGEKITAEEKTTQKSSFTTAHLTYVDGKPVTAEEEQKINPNDIESINVLKGESATKKYGEKGKDGVIEITLKKRV